MCCTRLAGNTGRQKSPFWHHRTTLLWSPYGIGQTIIFSSCGFFMATLCNRGPLYFCPVITIFLSSSLFLAYSQRGWNRLAGLGHPSKFQRVSRFVFVTAATSLNESQPNFARCLAVMWAHILHIHTEP